MSARDAILSAVRANLPKGEHVLPELPRFPPFKPGDAVTVFRDSLIAMGGRIYEGEAEGVIHTLFPDAAVIASAVPEVAGNRPLGAETDPRSLADVDVAVVRAVFGVAETGSVLFTEDQLVVNAVAYLAQHLVVLLDPAAIVETLGEAYLRPEFMSARYAVFHSGPSATADIEGVLIHGAQGVRSLTVILRS